MNKSDIHEILKKTDSPLNCEISAPQTPRNPAFLGAVDPEIGRLQHDSDRAEQIAKIRLAQFQDQELLKLWLHGKAKKTQIDYRRIALELLDSLGDQTLKDVTESYLQAFVDLAKQKSLHTQKQRVAILKSLFRFSVKKKFLVVNLADDLRSLEAHNKISERYLTEEEVFRMIDRTENFRNKTILKVMYGTGLRVSELVSLNWDSVQKGAAGEGMLTVIGKRSKKRTVGLSPGVFHDLMKLRSADTGDSDPTFMSREQGRISIRQVHLIVRAAALTAGIPKKVSPHWMRHAHASHSLDRGCPLHVLQRNLGHSKLETLGEYLHARPADFSGRYLGM
jgi:integrase/recombinase XerD